MEEYKKIETEGHFAFERIKAYKVRFTSVLLFLRASLSLNNMGKAVLKSQSLGLWNKLEIKEGNPAKDFQQGDPPNICLNSFQIVGWTLSCIFVQGDTKASRRKGQMESWKDRAEVSVIGSEGEIELDFWAK